MYPFIPSHGDTGLIAGMRGKIAKCAKLVTFIV
jgi:hypothetical protein